MLFGSTGAVAQSSRLDENAPRSIGGDVEAVQAVAREVPVFLNPAPDAKRRGTLQQDAVAFVHVRRKGPGCVGDWMLIGPSAWSCESLGQFEARAPRVARQPDPLETTEFGRVVEHGALGYASISQAEQQLPDAELQPGFFVGIVEERSILGEPYVRTTHGLWIARRDLTSVTPSDFEGVELEQAGTGIVGSWGTDVVGDPSPNLATPNPSTPPSVIGFLPLGWIFVDRAVARRTPGGPRIANSVLPRLTGVRVLEHRRHSDRHEWFRTPTGWFSDQQLRVPSPATPPTDLAPNERWLDIDRGTQTLLAYIGSEPMFATLVSTGRGPFDGPSATPAGTYRIWVKLTASDMDNLDEGSRAESAEATAPYAVEAVPFVMFFHRGYGLHATYWHDALGTPRSHGCVNLSIRDAARIFEFSSPKRAPGWQAVHPYAYDPGTRVRIR